MKQLDLFGKEETLVTTVVNTLLTRNETPALTDCISLHDDWLNNEKLTLKDCNHTLWFICQSMYTQGELFKVKAGLITDALSVKAALRSNIAGRKILYDPCTSTFIQFKD
jgi:hypothetical protein